MAFLRGVFFVSTMCALVGLGAPVRAAGCGDTTDGFCGSGGGEGAGTPIEAPGLPRVPILDGYVDPMEWDGSLVMDIASDGRLPVQMYLRHNGRSLFVAFVDNNDSVHNTFDEVGLYFDDEGSTPPVLYDNLWTAAACPANEGNFWVGNFAPIPNDQYRGFAAGPTTCSVVYGGTNVTVAFALQGGVMHWEIAVDLVTSELKAAPGDTFAWKVFTFDYGAGVFNGEWPVGAIYDNPATYGNIRLGELLRDNPVAVMAPVASNAETEYDFVVATLIGMGYDPMTVANIHEASSVGAPVLIDWSGSFNNSISDANSWIEAGRGFVHVGDWPALFNDGREGPLTASTHVTVTVNNPGHPVMQGLPASWMGRGYWYYGWWTGAYGFSDGSLGEVDLANIVGGGYPAHDYGVSALDRGPGRSGRAVFLGLNVFGPEAGAPEITLLGNALEWLTEDIVFHDGFEVGRTMRWDSTVP